MSTILDIDYNDYNSVIKGFTVELLVKSSIDVDNRSEEDWNSIYSYRDTILMQISEHFNIPFAIVHKDYLKYIDMVVEIDNERKK